MWLYSKAGALADLISCTARLVLQRANFVGRSICLCYTLTIEGEKGEHIFPQIDSSLLCQKHYPALQKKSTAC